MLLLTLPLPFIISYHTRTQTTSTTTSQLSTLTLHLQTLKVKQKTYINNWFGSINKYWFRQEKGEMNLTLIEETSDLVGHTDYWVVIQWLGSSHESQMAAETA